MENGKYCLNCMSKVTTSDPICPICKGNVNGTGGNERILPAGMILFGRYLLGKAIGDGGFGITYLGLDLNLQIKVAIKEYFPISFVSRNIEVTKENSVHVIGGESEALYKKGLTDYAHEANRLSQFSELPGVVSVMNFFYENNTAYIVMEYVDGITLKDYLKTNVGKISWKKTLEMVQPVITSLQEVHKAGIVHRDISPDNIMITKQGKIVLIDFGAARNVDKNQNNTVILKKSYAPLEQYRTSGNQGPWTDVYSLCATMYRMISGEKLPDAMAIAGGAAHVVPLRKYDSSIPKAIDQAIQKGLNIVIEERIQSMEELAGYLYQGKVARKSVRVNKKVVLFGSIALAAGIGLAVLVGKSMVSPVEEETKQEEETQERKREEQEEREIEKDKEEESSESVKVDEMAQYTDTPVSLISYTEEQEGITINSVDYMQTEVVIPSEIEGKKVIKVSGVSPNAVSVIIKESTEIIGTNAFANCVYLESVYIPASVKAIEQDAFKNCEMLTQITVSEDNPDYYSENGNLYTKDGKLVYGKN